jgi:glutathione synthase/RimK-type ligase-like ATP-grasp enzyme
MVLIISHLADEHATEVHTRLCQVGIKSLIFDLSRFPRETTITIHHLPQGDTTLTALMSGEECDLGKVKAVWWRRPQPIMIDSDIATQADREFTFGECSAAIHGLWSCLDATWINDPERDEVAGRKAYQLSVARSVGLIIPETLITNDPEKALAFISKQGDKGTIYKAFSATLQLWRETRLLQPAEIENIQAVKHAPVIFQQQIVADIDLRITIIGQKIFAGAIYRSGNQYAVDFRVNLANPDIRPHTLPKDIEKKLFKLMNRLGLEYGAIDMRLTPDGHYVFLEINPAGQWLFIEHETHQPITEAIVNHLASFC